MIEYRTKSAYIKEKVQHENCVTPLSQPSQPFFISAKIKGAVMIQ